MGNMTLNNRILAASLRRSTKPAKPDAVDPRIQADADVEPTLQDVEVDSASSDYSHDLHEPEFFDGHPEDQEQLSSLHPEYPPSIVEPSAPPLLRELSLGSFVIEIRGMNGDTGSSLTLEVQNDGGGLVLRAKSQGFNTSIAGESQPLLDFPFPPGTASPSPAQDTEFTSQGFIPPHADAVEHIAPAFPSAEASWPHPDAQPVSDAIQPEKKKRGFGVLMVGTALGLLTAGAGTGWLFLNAPTPMVNMPTTAPAVAAITPEPVLPTVGLVQVPDKPTGTDSPTVPTEMEPAASKPETPAQAQQPIQEQRVSTQPQQVTNKPKPNDKSALQAARPQDKKPVVPVKQTETPGVTAKALPPPQASSNSKPTSMPVVTAKPQLPIVADKPQTGPNKDDAKSTPVRIHEQTAMSLRQIVSPSEGKLIAWFADPSGREAPFREGERLPSGELVKKIDMAKGSVAVTSADGVSTVFFVGK